MKTRNKWLLAGCILLAAAAVLFFSLRTEKPDVPDYALEENWAYRGIGENRDADLFLICPTVYGGNAEHPNMSLSDGEARESFLGALNMERGIYEADCRMYAPYYRQAGLTVYGDNVDIADASLDAAYADVKAAFSYYLAHDNGGRPIVLAGFSQGAEHCLRLLKDVFSDEALRNKLVGVYMIGWRVTEDDLSACPWIRMASSENDYGSVVCFSSEAPDVTSSLIIPAGMKTYSINPLNWKTDGTPADKSENLGACFTDYSGGITKEIPALCGCYIDDVRGALKVTDVTAEEYPPVLSIFSPGEYHLYDYQFFYRNLEKNVSVRIDAYLDAQAEALDAAA